MKIHVVLSLAVFYLVLPLAHAQSGTTAAAPPAPKQTFYMKLVAPRPTFAQDMTPEETKLMVAHAAYWKEIFATGKVLIIGPVMEAKGSFGIAVLEVANEDEAWALANADPSVKAGLNKVELSPMHVFLMRK